MVSLCAGGELHPNSWRVCKQADKAELFREDTSDVRADAALQILSCQLTKVCNMSGIPATEQFWCEGLLGCPLHCKSHLAAFYNGSPDVTFGRELQMATMWEGYCAFDAICTVINSVKKKKKSLIISATSSFDVSSMKSGSGAWQITYTWGFHRGDQGLAWSVVKSQSQRWELCLEMRNEK